MSRDRTALVVDDDPSAQASGMAIDRAAAGMLAVGLGAALVTLGGTPWWIACRLIVIAAVTAALVRARETGWRWCAIASVALPVGATFALRYAPAGVWLRTIGGVLLTVGGLVLAARGAALLLRSVRGWRKLLAVPVVLVVTYFVALPIGVAVFATNVPRPTLGSATPADRGLPYEDVTFPTADGVRLSAWYIPSSNGAAVVVLHGASSTRSDVLDQAVVLARHGYGLLLVDARGHGRSGGRAMDFGWYGDLDVGAAASFLSQRPDVDVNRIGALGESMGGEEAIGAMAADRRLRAVVAEGATNRVAGDLDWMSKVYGARGWITERAQWVTYAVADLLTAARPPGTLGRAVAAAAPRPVLLVVAGTVADETHAAEAMRAASPSAVEVWRVPGAGHTGGLRTDPHEWEQQVVGFLDRSLLS